MYNTILTFCQSFKIVFRVVLYCKLQPAIYHRLYTLFKRTKIDFFADP